MKKAQHLERQSDDRINVLSITTSESDESDLERMIDPGWVVRSVRNLTSGIAVMRNTRFSMIICDEDSVPGGWKEVLQATLHMDDPPHVIVTSRLADNSLWAEALNLGAYDVLAKPFDAMEVSRILSMAHMYRPQQRADTLSALA